MGQINEIYAEKLNRAIHFIESNLDKKILLKDIAAHAYLSEFHFHRIFKSATGETIKEFQLRLKIERAAIGLKYSQNTIGQIAFDNGFENQETFTRAFKKHFGYTPLEYRERAKHETSLKQSVYAQTKQDLGQMHVSEPVIKLLPDLHLAYIRHNGSYDKVASSFQQLMLWAVSNIALKLKPVTLGIVHDNPDLTEEEKIRFDACVLLSKPLKSRGKIGYKKVEGGKFAVFSYKGRYENFLSVYDYIYNVCLFEYKWELADKPALEWYVKSPPFYSPENYVTDFCVPLK